jgi:DNA invertase Pin-like site-specific DNA recombinase
VDTHLYLRQSLDKLGDAAAVDRQEKECRAYARKHGLRIVAVYTDNDVSATSGVERPEFERLLAARPVSILSWHQDRLLRLTKDLERVIALDVPVYTVMAGTLDLSTPAGRAVARTVAAWSQYETEQKAERQKAAHRQRAANGEPWGTTRAFGFQQGNVEHDETEAPILRWMYDELLAGKTQAAIARELNSKGILTAAGKPWRQSGVRQLLIHPRNAGLRAHTPSGTARKPEQHVVGKGTWEGIVSEETWRAAVAILTAKGPRAGGGKRVHLLSGLARCGVCGATMRTAKNARGYQLYQCTEGQHVGRNREKLDELVRDVILLRLGQPDALELVTRDDADDAGELHKEAAAAREALDAMAAMFGAGTMTLSAFQAGTSAAQQRLAAVEAQMVDAGRADRLGNLVGAEDLRAAWDALDLPRKRGVIDALMVVHVDKTTRGGRFRPEDVRIEWRIG